MAFPAISCGVYGYPLEEAAPLAVGVAREPWDLEEIRFVLFGEPTYRVFEMANDAAKIQQQMDRLRSR